VLEEAASVVKVMVQGCVDCTLVLNGKVSTDTFELWRSERVVVDVNCRLATVQVDISKEITFRCVFHTNETNMKQNKRINRRVVVDVNCRLATVQVDISEEITFRCGE
jgi:hypothetical protein